MKNRRKQGKVFRSLLAVLMLTAMLVTGVLQPVFAGDYEAGKTGNLTLTLQQASEDGTTQTPLQNVGLALYKVGGVDTSDGNVHFVLDPALASTGIDFDSIHAADGWYAAAEKLATAVIDAGMDGTPNFSDEKGNMTFEDLAEGMYLVVQNDGSSSVTVSPMLISIPFADEDQGWLYDVTAYPKSVSNPQTQTQIQVTKRIYNVDDQMNIVPLEAEDATYKVGLFLDPEGTAPYGEPKDIHIQGASSGTATWTDVPEGTYYVFELDEDGNTLQQNDPIVLDDTTSYYYTVTGANEENSNEAVIGGDSNATEAVAYVNNYYSTVPDNYTRTGYINIKKNVMVDGVKSTVDDTFYAGVFTKESNGDLTLGQLVTLKQNGTVLVTFEIPADADLDDYTYTILETDKDGNPVDDDTFKYTVTGQGEVTLNSDNRYNVTKEITNSLSSGPTATPNPTVTPGGSGGNQQVTPVPNGGTANRNTPNDTSGTARKSVKTGDDTPIGVWVGILAAAIVIGGGAAYAVKRKKKK